MATKKSKSEVYVAPTIEQYKAMTAAEKRVTIAKDVVAALNTERYIARASEYMHSFKIGDITNEWYWLKDDEEEWDIQQKLPEMKECNVCAMGACILSITKYENKLKMGDVSQRLSRFTESTDNLIKEVFTPEQLAMIEILFEGYYDGISCDTGETDEYGDPVVEDSSGDNYGRDRLGAKVSDEDALKCIQWYHTAGYKDDDNDRMYAIFNHIIANNGEVVPSKL